MKIRTKIILSSLMPFIVFTLVIGVTSNIIIIETVKEESLNLLDAIAESKKVLIENFIESNNQYLKLLSSRTKLRNTLYNYNLEPNQNDIETMREILNDALDSTSIFTSISILDKSGNVLVSTITQSEGDKSNNSELFLANREYEEFRIIEDSQDVMTGYAFGPLLLNGDWLGQVTVKVNIDSLLDTINNRSNLGESGESLLAYKSQNGDAIFINNSRYNPELDNKIIVKSDFQDDPIFKALNGEEISGDEYYDFRGERIVAVTKYIEKNGWGLKVKMDYQEVYSTAYNLGYFLGTSFFVFIIIFILILFYSSKKITEPISKLKKAMENSNEGDYDNTISIKSNDEVADLSKTFNDLLSNLKKNRKDINNIVTKRTEKLNTIVKQLVGREKKMVELKKRIKLLEKNK